MTLDKLLHSNSTLSPPGSAWLLLYSLCLSSQHENWHSLSWQEDVRFSINSLLSVGVLGLFRETHIKESPLLLDVRRGTTLPCLPGGKGKGRQARKSGLVCTFSFFQASKTDWSLFLGPDAAVNLAVWCNFLILFILIVFTVYWVSFQPSAKDKEKYQCSNAAVWKRNWVILKSFLWQHLQIVLVFSARTIKVWIIS